MTISMSNEFFIPSNADLFCRFHTLFAMHDNRKTSQLFYLSSLGFAATKKVIANEEASLQGDSRATLDDASSEDDANPEDG